MKLTRRDMLLASIGLITSGCATRSAVSTDRRKHPQAWHEPVNTPPAYPAAPMPRATHHAMPAHPNGASDPLAAIARKRWTRSSPIGRKVHPMNGINRITVHHEGWKPFFASDNSATSQRLEQIRRTHVSDRGWGDIGYHYVIDRSGLLWEGRPLRLQGAHVKDHNPHNLGIMLLGNFDRQSPTKRQIDRLGFVLRDLMRKYHVPVYRVKTHQELMPTACPGKNLQSIVARMRSTKYLA